MDKDKIIKFKGNQNEWYKEVIFVIPPNTKTKYTNAQLIDKANILIGNYAKKQGLHKKNKELDRTLDIILISSIMILIFVCILLL